PPLLLCPLPRENSPGRWINHREETTRMNTQNVNVKTAAPESSRKIGGKNTYIILVAENGKNSVEEWDVLEFETLAALKAMRRSSPEKMKNQYFYALSCGVDKQFQHKNVVEANHFKQFVRQIESKGINI
ncbi:hypothetical protein, partial [Enterobacter hormaechei]|uniref:hypothetical protein n=2 Tax=Enterobacteriaceae TaxID=543 RepID=UPI003B2207AC